MSTTTKQAFGAVLFTVTANAVTHFMYRKEKKVIEDESTRPYIKFCADKKQVSTELCDHVVQAAKSAIEERGVFYLAVAGGSLLDALAGLVDYKDSIDFSKVVLCFANHKCVTELDEKATVTKAKNKFAKAAGITNIVAPFSKPMDGSDGSKEAAHYAQCLLASGIPHCQGLPVMDLIILGLGADGHVGSCHPMGAAVKNTTDAIVASPGNPSSITMTIEAMNAAKQVVVVVCGSAKKESVKRALTRPAEEPRGIFPAQLLDAPIFFLDGEAAAEVI